MNDTAQPNPEPVLEATVDCNGTVLGAGDVVTLLHDDNLMTVEFADETDRSQLVSCIWFDANLQLQRANFVGKTLLKAESMASSNPNLDS